MYVRSFMHILRTSFSSFKHSFQYVCSLKCIVKLYVTKMQWHVLLESYSYYFLSSEKNTFSVGGSNWTRYYICIYISYQFPVEK